MWQRQKIRQMIHSIVTVVSFSFCWCSQGLSQTLIENLSQSRTGQKILSINPRLENDDVRKQIEAAARHSGTSVRAMLGSDIFQGLGK
jgi:hypothetical protein